MTETSPARGEGRPRRLRFVWVIVALAVALASPSLFSGLQTEDFAHRALARSTSGWVNCFGDPGDPRARNAWNRDRGFDPWLAVPELRVSMWRPLASLTHLIDYRTFPDSPALMHAESLAWFGALVAAVGFFYRRFASSEVAFVVALFFYAADDARGQVVGWLANRSALLATTFGVLALIAHDRGRREGWKAGAPLAFALTWLGLLSAETAVGTVGYAVAYALTLDPAKRKGRLLALAPFALALLSWALPYRWLGYGVTGSGGYVDPGRQPLDFAWALVERLPLLVTAQLTGTMSEVLDLSPWTDVAPWAAFAVLVVVALVPLVRREPSARFFAVGMVLSAVPASGTLPADRLLTFVALGGSGLIGALVVEVWRSVRAPGPLPPRLASALIAVPLAVVHGVLSPALLPVRASGLASIQRAGVDQGAVLLGDVSPGQQLVVVTAPDYYWAGLVLFSAQAAGRPVPDRTRTLYAGADPVKIRRTAPDALLVTAPRGFLRARMNRMYRGRSYPLHAGQVLAVSGMRAVVREVTDGGEPLAVEFTFEVPLEDPRFVWRRWSGDRPVPFAVPRIGAAVLVPQAGEISASN